MDYEFDCPRCGKRSLSATEHPDDEDRCSCGWRRAPDSTLADETVFLDMVVPFADFEEIVAGLRELWKDRPIVDTQHFQQFVYEMDAILLAARRQPLKDIALKEYSMDRARLNSVIVGLREALQDPPADMRLVVLEKMEDLLYHLSYAVAS